MEPPEPPDESDCCNSGCNPCILDVYENQLKKYKEFIKNSNNPQTIINAINPTSYSKFKLSSKEQLSQTILLLKFEYSDSREKIPNTFLYKPGQYILLRAKDKLGEFTRAYTPIPKDNTPKLGFTILVRIYENGRMSKWLKRLDVGAITTWRGPYGDFTINSQMKHLFCIAQGAGIAPIFALINELLKNEEFESFIKLFYCCRDSTDILLRKEFHEFGAYWNFSCEIFLSNAANLTRKYNEIVHEMKLRDTHIEGYLNGKVGKVGVLICGSEAFSQAYLNKIERLGVEKNDIHLF